MAAVDKNSSERMFRRAVRAMGSPRSQQIQIRVYALTLFVLGVLLTFNSSVFNFVAQFTDRPEILPSTLLIPYVYLVFQVVIWQLDRDEDAELEQIKFDERHQELAERVFERRSAIASFDRGMKNVPEIAVESFASQIGEWMAERVESDAIEVLMLSYSSETLLSGCLAAARLIERNKEQNDGVLPNQIDFKLLVRDPESEWRIPFIREKKADQVYRAKLKGRFSQHLARWDNELPEAFRKLLYRDQLKIEIRYYPFEPLLKGAVIRALRGGVGEREVGLVGIYGTHSVREGGVEGVDYHGWGSAMFRISKLPDSDESERSACEEFMRYFDEIWSMHSRPHGDD